LSELCRVEFESGDREARVMRVQRLGDCRLSRGVTFVRRFDSACRGETKGRVFSRTRGIVALRKVTNVLGGSMFRAQLAIAFAFFTTSVVPAFADDLHPAQLSPGSESPPPFPQTVALVHTPPGCPARGGTNLNLVTALFDHFTGRSGGVYVASAGTATIRQGERWLFPAESALDALAVSRFLAEPAGVKREVLEAGVPYLDGPHELLVQYPFQGHFDWISIVAEATKPNREYPDTVVRHGDVVRYSNAAGASVLALEARPRTPTEGAPASDPPFGPPQGPITAWERVYSGVLRVESPDDRTFLYSIGRRAAPGSRMVGTLAGLRRPSDLLLHPGGIVPVVGSPALRALCGKALAELRPDAVVPREADLALGPAELAAEATRLGLPLVAANLQAADGSLPFPRFRLIERGGLTLAVIGLVDRDQVSRLPASVRSQWKVERPVLALERTLEELERQLRRRPDLTVVLAATHGENYGRLLGTTRVDVAVGLANRYDLLATRQTVELLPGRSRERVRNQPVLLAVQGSDLALGRVEVTFGPPPAPGEPPVLQRLSQQSVPIDGEGPRDLVLEQAQRALEEEEAPRGARVLLPDVAGIIRRHPELDPLIWGERILHANGYRDYPRLYPARFSDPLWMRFVTSLLRESVGAEIALSRNLPRGFDSVGPVTREALDVWLRAPDAVRLVRLTGAELARLALRFENQSDDALVPPASVIFASGFDPKRLVVGGRPLDAAEQYTVAVTDAVLEMADLAPFFQGREAADLFAPEPSAVPARFVPRADGRPLSVAEVVQARLEAWASSSGGDFDAAHLPELERALADQADILSGRWVLRLNELSLAVAQYANTANVGTFAESRETRTTTPDNLTLDGGLDTALVYDGPAVAWENGLRGTLKRTVLDIPGQDIPPQEQADDLVARTELRLNAVRLEIGADRVPLVPFLQAAFDTELTATPNPTASDPDATYPHQYILRGSLGVVSYPGPRFREVRLGALVQRDLSEDEPHDDLGFVAGYRFELPLLGPLVWSSSADLRYTVPDDDDRRTDLGLVLSAVNKILVPVVEGASVFGLCDLYLVRGKVSDNREIGGSYVLGGGLQLSRIFKL
jgi:hypothetical protein